jgi:hypothetical protein
MKFYRTKTLDIMTENQISANLRFIENKSASGKVVISKDFDENLIISGPDNRAKIQKKQHL